MAERDAPSELDPAAAPVPSPASRAPSAPGAHPAIWFFAGAAVSAIAFSLAVLFRLVGAH
jgi:hypothetical protein